MAKKTVTVTDDTPRWLVNERSFIGHAIVEAGNEISYDPEDGDPKTPTHIGENLTPTNEAAQAIVDAQPEPHPDKSDGKRGKSAKARADAAAAGVEATEPETGEFA